MQVSLEGISGHRLKLLSWAESEPQVVRVFRALILTTFTVIQTSQAPRTLCKSWRIIFQSIVQTKFPSFCQNQSTWLLWDLPLELTDWVFYIYLMGHSELN